MEYVCFQLNVVYLSNLLWPSSVKIVGMTSVFNVSIKGR